LTSPAAVRYFSRRALVRSPGQTLVEPRLFAADRSASKSFAPSQLLHSQSESTCPVVRVDRSTGVACRHCRRCTSSPSRAGWSSPRRSPAAGRGSSPTTFRIRNSRTSRSRASTRASISTGSQGSPAGSIPVNGFSARWTGKVQAQYSQTYTFYTNSDEGVALWVNGQQIIDNFTDHTLTEDSGTITLTAGETYNIRVDYYENAFDAQMQLSWSSDSTTKQIIPTSQLYPDSAGRPAPGSTGTSARPNLRLGQLDQTTYTVNGGGSA
jgi:hypothetical protein